MSDIPLAGMSAGTPIGFLASLGTFRHASQLEDQFGEVRLSWQQKSGTWIPVLSFQHDVDPTGFLTAFVTKVCSLGTRAEFGWAEQIKKQTVEDFRRAIAENPACSEWMGSFASELGLARDGTLRSTFLDMSGGPQKFLLKLRNASEELCGSDKAAHLLLNEALFGPWLYRASKGTAAENTHSLGLDPSTLLEGAFTATAPAETVDKRGVRGAIWLAFEAMPFFPCIISEGQLSTTGFIRSKNSDGNWKSYLQWGVWETPMNLRTVEALVMQSREVWTRERGVAEAFRSERVNLNKDYYSLGHAQLI